MPNWRPLRNWVKSPRLTHRPVARDGGLGLLLFGRRVAALLHLGALEGGDAARLGQADVGVAADGQFAAPAAVPVAQDPAGHAGGREREREAVAVGLGQRLAGLDPVPELQVRQVALVPCHAHPRCSDVGWIAATRLATQPATRLEWDLVRLQEPQKELLPENTWKIRRLRVATGTG